MPIGVRTILIADDDAQSRLLVKTSLGREGFRLVEAADGLAAWRLIQEVQPELAILDLNMPGLSGLELSRRVAGSPKLPTQVILLTASVEDTRAGLEAGARLYLTKPFSPLDLRRLVHRIWVTAA